MTVNLNTHGQDRHAGFSVSIVSLIVILIFSIPWFVGCSKAPLVDIQSCPNAATSLLLITPLIGNEDSFRDPAPVPERLWVKEESVAGWLSPPERQLRFPIEFRAGARLNFRLGVVSEEPLKPGDLRAVVEFSRYDSGRREQVQEIHNTEISTDSDWSKEWALFDVDLSESGANRGELRFRLEGPRADDQFVKVLWGQPAIYHPAELKNKNVLLIGIDTLRSDGLSIYGGRPEVTPNIDRLIESATIFDNAWSQAPFTVPSFASMLTGRYPADLSPTLLTDILMREVVTVGEMLLPYGYATAIISGNTWLGNKDSGFEQGMESSFYRWNANPSETVEQAKLTIERMNHRDWFMFLHFMDPHGPYDPPQEFVDGLCNPDYTGEFQSEFTVGHEWQIVTTVPPETDVARARDLYDAEIADLDRGIGDLFDFLESQGLLENTLVIFAADHGEEFFEHGQFEHGQSLYEEMVHLPLMVWGDGFPEGERVDQCVANLDIVPTIFDYIEFPNVGSFTGTPLQSIVAGDLDENRMIFGEGNLRRSTHTKFVVDWPYKCIIDYFTGEIWLYNLENDPYELMDISAEYPDLTDELVIATKTTMVPLQTTFIMLIIGDPNGGPERLSGVIKVPGGIGFAKDAGFLNEDIFNIEGDTINFDVGMGTPIEEPFKTMVVNPVPGMDTIEVTVLADGEIDPERFYPYGNGTPEPTGTATVRVYDLPWPAQIPADAADRPVACYILGIPGYPRDPTAEYEQTELDAETLEQLRALGYIN